jgi:hypothetical protein
MPTSHIVHKHLDSLRDDYDGNLRVLSLQNIGIHEHSDSW